MSLNVDELALPFIKKYQFDLKLIISVSIKPLCPKGIDLV